MFTENVKDFELWFSKVYDLFNSGNISVREIAYRVWLRPTTGAVDLGDSSALEVDSAPEVLSAGQGESTPAPNH